MSDASVGSILAYLKLDRSDFDTELDAAGRKADELARHSPNIKVTTNAPSAIAQLATVAAAVKRLQDAEGAEGVAQARLTELRNKGNASTGQLAAAEERLQRAHRATAAATIQLAAAHDKNSTAMRNATSSTKATGDAADKSSFQMHALRDAALLLGPAIIPIAGVATGAILGLAPAAAVAILGLKGITQEYQSGALAGTQYQTDIKSVIDEFTNLKQTAANGLLGGVDQAIQGSQPLFGTLNQDVGALSGQLGSIVAGAGPALLTILNALNPLFVTFGQLISDGATKLEHWATSSDGISQFVGYVQAELPTVITALGQLVEIAGRLLVALAPMGHVILSGIGTLVGVLNAIPVPVLNLLATGALSAYAAFRVYGAVNAIVSSVTGALERHAAASAAASLRVQASLLSERSAQAETAAAAQVAAAEKDAAAAESAVAIAASVEGTNSVLRQGAVASADAATVQATASRAAADAATASAAQIRVAAAEAAAAVETDGAAAAGGWAAMLGPIGAVVVGVGLLGATLLHGGQSAQQAAVDQNSYTQALLASKGVIDDTVRAGVAKTLSDKGALDAADQLGIALPKVTDAVTGQGTAYEQLKAQLAPLLARYKEINQAQNDGGGSSHKYTDAQHAQAVEAKKLSDIINQQAASFGKGKDAQQAQAAATDAGTAATNAQVVAAAKLYGLTGTGGVAAYLAAKQAAQQNTAQSAAQTLQFQMENDAASLLAQTLDKLAGKNLGYAQAQNQFEQALVNMVKHTSAADAAVTGLSSSAIKNRGDLLNLVTSAESTAEAYGKMKGSSEAGRQELIKLRGQIIDNAVAHGEDRQKVTDYINTILSIPKSVPPTKLQIDSAKALADIALVRKTLLGLPFVVNAQVHVTANGQDLSLTRKATGGTVPGTGNADDTMIAATPGEEVVNKEQSQKHRALIKAINDGTYKPEHHATGGTVGGDVVSLTPKSVSSSSKNVWWYAGQQYSSERAAENAKASAEKAASKADAKTEARLTGSDTKGLYSSLNGSASQISAAIGALMGDASKLGGSKSLTNALKADNTALQHEANERATIASKLASAQTALNNAVSKYNSERSSVAGAVTGTFNISSAGTAGTSTGFASGVAGVSTSIASNAVGVSSILTQITQAAADAHKFYDVLRSLSKKGLSKVLLDQLAWAGPGALPQALALDAASSGQLGQINRQESSLVGNANATGKFLADQMDGAGVRAAQGLVNGLKSQDKQLKDAMKHLADVMVGQIKKDLKINSPSLVMHELGQFTGQGFAHGIGSQALFVRSQSMRLAGAAVPSISRPGVGGGSSGLQLVQHIYPQAGQSEQQIAKASASETVWALRR